MTETDKNKKIQIDRVANWLTAETLAGSHSMDIRNNLCAVVGRKGNVSLIDISDPENLKLLSGYTADLKCTEAALFIDDKYLFIGDYGRAFVMNIADPANPFVISNTDLTSENSPLNPGALNGASRYGNYVYCPNKGDESDVEITHLNGSVEIFNVSDPENMRYAGCFRDPDEASTHGISVIPERGILVYVNQMNYRNVDRSNLVNPNQRQFAVMDISGKRGGNPESPKMLSYLRHPLLKGANQVYAEGNYAYVVSIDANNLSIIDISDPKNSRLIASTGRVHCPVGVWKKGDYIFIANNNPVNFENTPFIEKNAQGYVGQVTVVDVSDPFKPIVIDEFRHKSLVGGHQLQRKGDYLYVTAGGGASSWFPNFISLALRQ